MKDSTRRAVAYIAGRLASKKNASHIYDYSAGSHFPFGGTVDSRQVNAYDYRAGCHVTGSGTSLYHYDNGKHISLSLDGGQFTGYDYD